MINSKVDHCKTLQEFYSEIRRQQEEAHGHDYCRQHDAIQRLMKYCTSYKELGTHQGATAAAALLTIPLKVELVDISMEKFNASRHLFEEFCATNDIELTVKEMSSIDRRAVSPCDLLLIDSLHQPGHLMNELRLHSQYVKKYIVCHDTSILNGRVNSALYNAIVNFTNEINPWIIAERNTDNVGYTVLRNTINA